MDAMTYLRERVALFAGVSDENLASLAQTSELLTFSAGQTILFKGATVDGLHVVASGKVGIVIKVPNKPAAQVAELGAGEVFGEMSIVEMGTAAATVKCLADDTMVLVIPQESFRRVLQEDEAFAVRVNELIASRRAAAPAPVTR
ncbi:MAG: cyclic nucleotide-binding domain-containing protein [Elusimicrobiota bacterium]|nr:MAG: cyclic nucleotide-binding domain-containing protein [Elusimicrobiota bacterium]